MRKEFTVLLLSILLAVVNSLQAIRNNYNFEDDAEDTSEQRDADDVTTDGGDDAHERTGASIDATRAMNLFQKNWVGRNNPVADMVRPVEKTFSQTRETTAAEVAKVQAFRNALDSKLQKYQNSMEYSKKNANLNMVRPDDKQTFAQIRENTAATAAKAQDSKNDLELKRLVRNGLTLAELDQKLSKPSQDNQKLRRPVNERIAAQTKKTLAAKARRIKENHEFRNLVLDGLTPAKARQNFQLPMDDATAITHPNWRKFLAFLTYYEQNLKVLLGKR